MLRQRTLFTSLALIVSATTLVVAPASSSDLGTCLGKTVTILATEEVTMGTEGDDVVATSAAADGGQSIRTLGGNDTICFSTEYSGYVDAGAGDDVVVNVRAPGVSTYSTTVYLGSGSDTFTGADNGEVVYADELASIDTNWGRLTGSQQDTITGAATVYSFGPSDGPNQDRIAFGSTGATAIVDGPMGADGSLSFSAGGQGGNSVVVVHPGHFAAPGFGDLLVDNVNSRMTVAGASVVAWSGPVRHFSLGSDLFPTQADQARPISFIGSDDPETVSLTRLPVGDVSLGGGNDTLTVEGRGGFLPSFIPRSMDAGAGEDRLTLETQCRSLTVRMGKVARCDGRSSRFVGFESTKATARIRSARISEKISHVTLVGTNVGETLWAEGGDVVVRGRGGNDALTAYGFKTRVFGEAGRDTVFTGGGDVVARGGVGSDRIWLLGPPPGRQDGDTPSGPRIIRHVAFGGPGADRLYGTSPYSADRKKWSHPDRLIGGPGHDHANGRDGNHDYCVAEVTKNCERPRPPQSS